jgi:hypothetical protein
MSESREFGLVCSFWIDTPAYSDRDRMMFVAGVEFQMVFDLVQETAEKIARTIHRENESRIRMMCAKFGRRCEVKACPPEHDPDGVYSYLVVFPSDRKPKDSRP